MNRRTSLNLASELFSTKSASNHNDDNNNIVLIKNIYNNKLTCDQKNESNENGQLGLTDHPDGEKIAFQLKISLKCTGNSGPVKENKQNYGRELFSYFKVKDKERSTTSNVYLTSTDTVV